MRWKRVVIDDDSAAQLDDATLVLPPARDGADPHDDSLWHTGSFAAIVDEPGRRRRLTTGLVSLGVIAVGVFGFAAVELASAVGLTPPSPPRYVVSEQAQTSLGVHLFGALRGPRVAPAPFSRMSAGPLTGGPVPSGPRTGGPASGDPGGRGPLGGPALASPPLVVTPLTGPSAAGQAGAASGPGAPAAGGSAPRRAGDHNRTVAPGRTRDRTDRDRDTDRGRDRDRDRRHGRGNRD